MSTIKLLEKCFLRTKKNMARIRGGRKVKSKIKDNTHYDGVSPENK